MLKIRLLIKSGLRQFVSWLWKTISPVLFYLYCFIKRNSWNQIIKHRYLIVPAVIALLIVLALSETILAARNEDLGQKMLILKISGQNDNATTEEGLAEKTDQKPDFTIASTQNTNESFNDPATTLGGAALISPDYILDEASPGRTDTEDYVVQSGDTVELIAKKFAISVNTILIENKLSSRGVIRPGQTLRILPVDGVTHKVKTNETIDQIAKYYKAKSEDIVDYNNLADATDIYAGDLLIIPEGQIPPPPPRKPTIRKSLDKTWLVEGGKATTAQGANCHKFVPGQCTWYVATKRCINWVGHAKQWLANARRAGFSTGSTPAIGAIIAIRQSWYGHVAYVEDFDDATVTFSEMNNFGPWIVNKRTLNRNDRRISGYIY